MEWLNYHHLFYFWTVAREGTITRAGEKLLLAQPTVTTQIQQLERAVGQKLFTRVGRTLQLTEMGKRVFHYADEIFTLGRELQNMIKGLPVARPWPFAVGIDDILPKLIVYRLLEPVVRMPEPIRLVCREDNVDHLWADLATGELDLILTDSPMPPSVKVRGFNHLLGECGIRVMGTRSLARKYRRGFPRSLEGAPFLLPMGNTSVRGTLRHFFDAHGLHPAIKGEFDDNALLEVFGQKGVGLFPVPEAIRQEVQSRYGVEDVGRLAGVKFQVYAISTERRVRHPAVAALSQAARNGFLT